MMTRRETTLKPIQYSILHIDLKNNHLHPWSEKPVPCFNDLVTSFMKNKITYMHNKSRSFN